MTDFGYQIYTHKTTGSSTLLHNHVNYPAPIVSLQDPQLDHSVLGAMPGIQGLTREIKDIYYYYPITTEGREFHQYLCYVSWNMGQGGDGVTSKDTKSIAIRLLLETAHIVMDYKGLKAAVTSSVLNAGYKIEATAFTSQRFINLCNKVDGFKEYSDELMESLTDTPNVVICWISVLFLSLTKYIKDTYYADWYRKRAFAYVAGVGYNTNKFMMPDKGMIVHECFINCHNAISSMFDFKRVLFQSLVTIGSMDKGDPGTIIANITINYFKYAEMVHIPVIVQHMINRNQELFCFYKFQSEYQAVLNMLEESKKYPTGELPFLKLLHPKEQLSPFKKECMIHTARMALYIASKTHSSYKNVKLGNTPSDDQDYERIYTEYCKLRNAVDLASTASHKSAGIGQSQQRAIHDTVNNDVLPTIFKTKTDNDIIETDDNLHPRT